MIHCVRFSAVEKHLTDLGFRFVEQIGITRIYERGLEQATIRGPNVNGDLLETIVNSAFYAAGLAPPDWEVFWCD